MAWDSTRPVPWQRLIREWLIYVAIMAVLFVAFFRDGGLVGIFAGLLVSGPIFLFFGVVMAKLGYQRKTLKELRAEPRGSRAMRRSGRDTRDDSADDRPRPKPAPTKRTGGGGGSGGGRDRGRPGGQRSKKRR